MKRNLCLRVLPLALVLLLAGDLLHAQAWTTNGVITNPTTNAILADSGPLTGTPHIINAYVASTVAAVVFVEWMDATNTTALKSQALFVGANSNTPFTPTVQMNEFNANERIRVRLNAGVTGQMQASIFVQ